MTSNDSKLEKVQTHFSALSSVAPSLNRASKELTESVAVLDVALQKLNVGVSVWVSFSYGLAEPPEYDCNQVGYTKVNGIWGIALRHIWGDESRGDEGEEGPWLFNDAPRELRIQCVDKIPDVIEALGKKAFDTVERIQQKTQQVRELAGVIEKIATEPRNAKGGK
ncbi:MAG TPA: hypothetical protein VN861_15875 [Candidatus Acidoferrales bacterium]|nr:hypothetical protein [Candidatus Acidoferrales bacterium]